MTRRPRQSQLTKELRDDLTDQPRPIVGRHLAVPFILFAFHAHRNSQGARHDLA